MIPHIVTETSITLVFDVGPQVIANSHPNYQQIREAIRLEHWRAIPALVDVPRTIARYSKGKVEIVGDEVMYDGKPLTGRLVEHMLTQLHEGFNISPLVNFLEKLKQNPRYSVVQELWDFIEAAQDVTLHPDGDILAYKLVRHDYLDIRTGSIDNSVGQQLPRLEQNEVDDDRHRTCSKGYHFCSAGYLPCYGPRVSRVVIVKINPADIVAIPVDYNFAKGRATTYKIIAEVPRDQAEKFFKEVGPVWSPDEDDYEDSYTDDEDYDEDDDIVFVSLLPLETPKPNGFLSVFDSLFRR